MISELLLKHSIRQKCDLDIANIRSKLKQCDTTPLSTGQRREIIDYFYKLSGDKVPTYWHEYFFSRNGNYSVKYIPTSWYHREIIYRLNVYNFCNPYVDKGLYDIYFPDVNRPKTIIKNINGYFYDGSSPITRDEAIERCWNINAAVSKPSLESMWGKGIHVFSVSDGVMNTGISIEELMDSYGKNYIIQEKVEQHEDMAKLNPTSLNTLRVLSYRHGNEVFILYVVVRIGRKDKTVDNETAGGINADIDLHNGAIIDCAYGTPSEKRLLATDVGTTLKSFKIPSFHKVVEIVKELHTRLPYFNLIGWDFGIDKAGCPIMIEWNRCPDLSQTAHGPAFGDMTEEIIKYSLKQKDSRFV